MIHTKRLLLPLLGLFVALLLPPRFAHAFRPVLAIPASPLVGEILTDGTWVVWTAPEQNDPNQPQTLYAASLRDGRPFTVATGLPTFSTAMEVRGNIAIDGGVVVWVAGSGMQRAIRTNNLATGQGSTVAIGEVSLPAIAGTMVSWWEHVGAEYARRPLAEQEPATLRARDIRTMAPPLTLAQTSNTIYRFGPSRMSQGWVVWSKASGAGYGNLVSWEIFAAPITGGTPRVVGDAGYAVTSHFDLVGDQVVYVKSSGSGRPPTNFEDVQALVIMTDLRTGTSTTSGPHGAVGYTSTDGRFIFWSKARDNLGHTDLWGYDPAADSAFLVASASTPDQYAARLAARAGTLVWIWKSSDGGMLIQAARVSDVLPTARRDSGGPGQLFFPETGHTLGGSFQAFWERSGGLPVFGYPLTEEFVERNRDTGRGYATQYLERQRYEYHPENVGTPYEVLLGRLGVEALLRQGRDWQSLPKATPVTPHYFAPTGHAIAPEFWDYWRSHGLEFGDAGVSEPEALALFGFPITEPQMERNSSGDTVWTQWFERARFEYHPNNPEPYRVLLGRLSADLLAERRW